MRASDFISGTVELIDRMLAIVVAALVVVHLTRPDLLPDRGAMPWIEEYRTPLLWSAGGLLALNLLPIVQAAFRPRSRSGYMVSRTPGGSARVSMNALQHSLSASARSVPDISRTRLKVQRLSPSHYRVVSLYWIPEGENAITLGERLRLVLKRRLVELVALGPKDRVDIQVDLAGVVKPGAAPSARPAEAPRRVEGFRGPVYPVDGVEGA